PFGLLETRLLLEPESAELAAALATEEQLQAIQAAYESMEGSSTPAHEDRAFHMAIAAACGNSALAATIAHVWELALHSPMFSRMEKHFVDANVWEKAQMEHGRILDAIKSRDKVRARSAMHDHLVSILARLRVDFGNEGIG
ncbi:MAG: FadR/GntR family transcriptional regulator, partial [Paenalcaligenes sp.]